MKLIRNRKMLQAKRRRYSHLMLSFRATIHECAQAMAKQDAMIEYLAKKAWKHGFGESLPDTKYCKKLDDKACDYECWKCWIDEAFDKVVNNADGK